MRTCKKCSLQKDEKEFRIKVTKHSKAGDEKLCVSCLKAAKKQRAAILMREKHRVARNKYTRGWYLRNKERSATNRSRNKLATYGLTPEDYDKIYNAQQGCCVICGKHSSEFSKRLCVDHCHHTGKVRGLLCTSCNVGIGRLQDDIFLLQRAIDYLKEFTD